MQIETIGKYQLHLIAHEIAESGRWDPFFTIMKFDDQAGDFRCVLSKRQVSGEPFTNYEAAIDAARRAGNALIEAGEV